MHLYGRLMHETLDVWGRPNPALAAHRSRT